MCLLAILFYKHFIIYWSPKFKISINFDLIKIMEIQTKIQNKQPKTEGRNEVEPMRTIVK